VFYGVLLMWKKLQTFTLVKQRNYTAYQRHIASSRKKICSAMQPV
jgi:hypothetical protein